MNDDDFKQTMIDYFDIEQQRHREIKELIMAQSTDILAKITAVSTLIDAMKAKFDTAMETIPAGHAAVLDTLAGPLDDLAAKITALGAEFEAKVKAAAPGTPAATGTLPVA
jgi:hypothetical protein